MINENQLFGQLKDLHVPEHVVTVVASIRFDKQDYSAFEGKYNDIKQDERDVENLKENFQKKLRVFNVHRRYAFELQKQKADLFEAFILDQAGKAGWFGSSSLFPTKENDDFLRGVDVVMEYEEAREKKHMGLALDVTFDSTSRLITEKFDSLVDEVERGTLSSVKYFETEKGVGLESIPRLVIGVNEKRVTGILDLWYAQGTKDSDVKELNENLLKRHYVQVILLLQMKHQLAAFKELARAYFHNHLVNKFAEALDFVDGLLDQKKDIHDTYKDKINDDETLKVIIRKTDELKVQIPIIREEQLNKRADKRLGINN